MQYPTPSNEVVSNKTKYHGIYITIELHGDDYRYYLDTDLGYEKEYPSLPTTQEIDDYRDYVADECGV